MGRGASQKMENGRTVLITDPRVANVPIKENNEACVDLLTERNTLMVDRSQSQIDSRSPFW